MMPSRTHRRSRTILGVLLSLCSAAGWATDPIDLPRERIEHRRVATASSAGIGADLSWLRLRAGIDGERLRGDGALAGLSGWRQWDSDLRVDGRLLAGRLAHDFADDTERGSALLAELVGTMGYAAGRDTRVHIGLGYRRTETSPVADGDRVTDELLVPIGVLHSLALGETWMSLIRAELVSVLTARERIEGFAGIDDERFRRTGGVELRLSAVLYRGDRPDGLTVSPHLRYAAQGDTESMRIGGVSRSIDDASTIEAGVRLVWFL